MLGWCIPPPSGFSVTASPASIPPGARRNRLSGAKRIVLAERLVRKGEGGRARELLEELLREDPENPQAHRVLTALLVQETDWAGLRREMERELRRYAPDVADYERSYLSLLFGEMPQGWDLYESRLRIPGKVTPRREFSQPRWAGEPFPGKTLLLHFEQGFGDTFMFVRYAPLVKARGGRVLLLVQKQLADVVATCPGVDGVVPEDGPLPPFDLHLPLPSLPYVFRTDLSSIPAEMPYLDVPSHVPHRQRLMEALAASAGTVRIGCAWTGSPLHRRDRERSMPCRNLAPLGQVPNASWFSFRYLPGPEAPLPGIVPLAPLLGNFSDTAYALSGMDLVITVDTALAHLAGAMGIPVLLMVHFQPDFRWMLEREDSPWYPSLRIYRQARPGDWGSVIRSILDDLSGGPV